MDTKQSIQTRITERVLEELRKGHAPWSQPWSAAGYMPTSLQTGKPYRGTNAFLLSFASKQFERPLWVTYKQAEFLGGYVRKGSKGWPVIYYSMKERINGDTLETETVRILRATTVFNVEQCEGVTIPAKLWTKREPVPVLDGVQTMLDRYTTKPEIYHRAGDEAFYSPMLDSITVPKREQYATPEGYAYTLAHELVHSTGHESRLNRKGEPAPFGSAVYAKEELVADIGAQMVLSTLGVAVDVPNSVAYIAGWLKALENDTSLIFKASSDAQKACDYMLGVQNANVEADEKEMEAVTV